MQTYLNEEIVDIYDDLKKYPIVLLILVLFISGSIGLILYGSLCHIHYSCTEAQQYFTMSFGLSGCIIILLFIIIPYLLRLLLNCLYPRMPRLPLHS